jgi:hypothetical protein
MKPLFIWQEGWEWVTSETDIPRPRITALLPDEKQKSLLESPSLSEEYRQLYNGVAEKYKSSVGNIIKK